MIYTIHPVNPQKRFIQKVVNILRNDGVIIYATKVGYALGCRIHSKKAMRRISLLNPCDRQNSKNLICSTTRQLQTYTKQFTKPVFKYLKSHIPGPYIFILEASRMVPKTILSRKKTVSFQIPDSSIPFLLADTLQEPILCNPIPWNESFQWPTQDPWDVYIKYQKQIDCMLDSGKISAIQTETIDCTTTPLLV